MLARILANPLTERVIITLIIVNAVTLGLETSDTVMASWGPFLEALDHAILAVFVVEILALPRYKYAVHRWEVTADGVYTLTGWLSRTWILVPISRIQTVDVTRGPLQRMFGLASVSVRTASAHGSVEIHQLDSYTAAQVADDLSKRANLYDDDAT